MSNCIFCKIRDRIIPKEFTYEDKDIMVFPDIHPLKPIHLLIVPKKHIEDLLMMSDSHFAKASADAKAMADKSRDKEGLMMKLIGIAQKMVKKFKLENKGYRVVINGGGVQIIDHLHIHLLGPLGKAAEM